MCKDAPCNLRARVSPASGIELSSDELLARPDLCAIDGMLYDIEGFAAVHPGGAAIAGALMLYRVPQRVRYPGVISDHVRSHAAYHIALYRDATLYRASRRLVSRHVCGWRVRVLLRVRACAHACVRTCVRAGAGAYDASALFHSMHPGKSPASSPSLQRFAVGRLSGKARHALHDMVTPGVHHLCMAGAGPGNLLL